MIRQDSVFGRRDRVMVQEVEGQTVLLDITSGEYFALNEVGGRVWELCDGARTVAEVVAVLCAEYDAPDTLVMTDASELLEGLAGAGLVAQG
jgi:glutamate synthase domain-containing protein 3